MKKFVMNSFGAIREIEEDDDFTMRDYFAAKAMQSIITDGKLGLTLTHEKYIKTVSEMSYEYADAMMETRND